MILIEAGQRDERSFESKLLFAAALAERGHGAVIDDQSVPDGWNRNQKYDAAPFLATLDEAPVSAVIVLGAETLASDTLVRLRSLDLEDTVPLTALGTFPDHQSAVAAQTRLAYALGREPRLVDIGEALGAALPATGVSPLSAPVRDAASKPEGAPELCVFLPAEWLDEPHVPPLLAALDNMPQHRLTIVMPGAGKDRLRQTRYAGMRIFGYSEVAPAALARQVDIAAFFGDAIPGERMAALAIDLMASGKAVVDCTDAAAFGAVGAPVLRGPRELAALPGFLEQSVVPNFAAIGRTARESPWIAGRSISRLEAAAGLAPSVPDVPQAKAQGRVVFVPTNGSGLGHAQRCTQIAQDLSRPEAALFLAFPSCVSMVQDRGFACLPLVQKSADHPEEFANDIVNYLRLRRTVMPADHLVFDGGYVFDSIHRTILEAGCSATWIRRGLLRPGQVADAPLDRERAFTQVLIPEEAFPELNIDYSRGTSIRRVGPVVQPAPALGRETVRARLAETFGADFDTLVVTMLGGGVAADRSAQLEAISGLLASRPRTLHLVVVWPHARVAPGIGRWPNTRLVRTRETLALMLAADAVVSAVGYNTFHEVIYNRIPAIFIPQVAPYLDDQERRARAASDRGLAETVLAHELLLLERRMADLLDRGGAEALRDKLAALDLPPTGNARAARLIEEEAAR